MAMAELKETFVGSPASHVRAKETFQGWSQIGVSNGRNQLARQTTVLIAATSDDHLIALFSSKFCSQQSNVADVVLRAGMRAACDVEVERLVDLELRFKPGRQLNC